MSYHTIQRKLESSAAAYLAAEIPTLGITIRTTEDAHIYKEARSVLVLSPRADCQNIPGNYAAALTVELRTILHLYADRPAAITAHFAAWGLLADAMMQDDLDVSLATNGTDIGINGIEDSHQLRQENQDGILVNAITRTVHAVPQTLT